MKSTRNAYFDKIDELIHAHQLKVAELSILDLIESLDVPTLLILEEDIRKRISHFFKKREKNLSEKLDSKLSLSKATADEIIRDFQEKLRKILLDLSAKHIFQWGSYYKPAIELIYTEVANHISNNFSNRGLLKFLQTEISKHTEEIFSKGAIYQESSEGYVIAKSLRGLRAFLDIPIEIYSALTLQNRSYTRSLSIRETCSALLTGILSGYGALELESSSGWSILPRFQKSWAHYLPFLVPTDLDIIITQLEYGVFRTGIRETLRPVLQGLNTILKEQDDENFCLLRLSHYAWERARRFEISLALPSTTINRRVLELHCYIDSFEVSKDKLSESANRDAVVIAARMRPDLLDWAENDPIIRPCLVNTDGERTTEEIVSDKVAQIIRFELSREFKSGKNKQPIKVNFAKSFPLTSPRLSIFYRVQRRNVRELLRSVEGSVGIRLWCSIRRSGKSTACRDIGLSTAGSLLINQTCENTEQNIDSILFYSKVERCLEENLTLPKDFFADIVKHCNKESLYQGEKIVFLLDEYETLFDRLRLAIKRDQEIRYRIVQPLLNQMVAFSRENLLVFVGQRPDAHYIIMDQNQLSPYVVQSQFPLFQHSKETPHSEFTELITKILTERIKFNSSFTDAIYSETSGHPFLTVNVLVEFCDWLINTKKQASLLDFTETDFYEFKKEMITEERLRRSLQYDFFRRFLTHCISEESRSLTPWLWTAVNIMRKIERQGIYGNGCNINDFKSIYTRLGGEELLNMDSLGFLEGASQANFLIEEEGEVKTKIKIVGRLASAIYSSKEV